MNNDKILNLFLLDCISSQLLVVGRMQETFEETCEGMLLPSLLYKFGEKYQDFLKQGEYRIQLFPLNPMTFIQKMDNLLST